MTIAPTEMSRTKCDFIRSTAIRRKLEADLLQIKKKFPDQFRNDHFSNLVISWHQNFSQALRTNGSLEDVRDQYIRLLKEIMIDPLTMEQLDDKAYLGSDGRVYGHCSLCLYQHSIPEEYRGRQPLDQENPTEFTVKPCQLARSLSNWLKNNDAYSPPPSVQERYDSLTEDDLRFLLPTKRNNRIRKIKLIQKKREHDLAKSSERLENLKVQTTQQIQHVFRPLHTRMDQFEEAIDKELNDVEEQMQTYAGQIQDRLSESNREIEQLEQDIAEVERQLANVDGQLSQMQQFDLHLQQRMTELEKAIKERENDLWKTIAKVAAIAVVSWFLPQGIALLAKDGGAVVVGTITL